MKKTLLNILLFLLAGNIYSQCLTTTAPVEDCSYGDQINAFTLNAVAAVGNAGCGANGYNSFASPVWTLQAGSVYAWSSTVGSGMYYEAFAIWIDLNNNGIFEASEQLASNGANMTHSGNITIPAGASAGPGRKMRIRCAYSSTSGGSTIASSDACTSGLGVGYGETEDYNVVITCPAVAVTPTLTITASSSNICLGGSATLTASGASTYTWTGGAGNVVNGASFTPNSTATYTVLGSLGCPGSTATAMKTISVSTTPLPISVAPTSTTICAGTAATLTGSGATSYTWLPGPVTGSNVMLYPSSSVVYTVIGVNTNSACPGATTVSVTVNAAPSVSVAASSTLVCVGDAATLTASGAPNFTWLPGGTTANTISVNPLAPAVYTLVGRNALGCESTFLQGISTAPLPTITAVANRTLICLGGSATLAATGADTYSWSPTDLTMSVVVNPASSTIYNVVGTTTLNQCSSTATVMVSVFIPTLTVSNATSVCNGSMVTLNASGATNYTWSTGGFGGQIQVSPATSTMYVVNATSNTLTLRCPSSGTVNVTVNPNPTLTATAQRSVMCKGETNTVTVTGATTYTWLSGGTASVSVFTATSAINYNFVINGTDGNGCMGSATYVVKANTCTGIAEMSEIKENGISIYPNPNSGTFMIRSLSDMDLQLMNELGQVIREISLSDQNEHVISVNDLANGIYFIKGKNGVSQKIVVTR